MPLDHFGQYSRFEPSTSVNPEYLTPGAVLPSHAAMIRFSPNPNQAHLVRWFEWSERAFEEAQKQDKLLMLFLDAFWCGFCQRMDEGAFSNDENIAMLNVLFIPIRVENAQRPDVDVRYSQNGWPTIAFLTPEGEQMATFNFLSAEQLGHALAQIHTFYRERKEDLKEALAKAYREASRRPASGEEKREVRAAAVTEIARIMIGLADGVHGGYGGDNKFPHAEANEFLLDLYESTRDSRYLDHVRLTLDKMSEGQIRDRVEGGFFRYSSKPDWSEPHREKLLSDQAGILGTCLRLFSMTQFPLYGQMTEGIIDYLNGKLSGPNCAAFYGCEDYVRKERQEAQLPPGPVKAKSDEFFSVIDDWFYTDANAQTASAYLEASSVLGRPDCRERALRVLSFLWKHCRESGGGMVHYFDGSPRVSGLLVDQLHVGLALLKAYEVTADAAHLSRAKELARHIQERFKNPDGGYYDLSVSGPALLRFRLTLLEQNGMAARFFLKLAQATQEEKYRTSALWALSAFQEDFTRYGIHAAGFGRALADFVKR